MRMFDSSDEVQAFVNPAPEEDPAIMQAVDTVAHFAVSSAAEPDFGTEVAWGNYPEIGEHDWELVTERVNEIRRSLDPPPLSYTAAYALLEARAEGQEA